MEQSTDDGDQQSSDIGKAFRSLPERFHPGIVDKTLTYYFSIDDEQWTVTVGPSSCEVTPGKTTENADCFLKTSKEIIVKTFNGEYTPSIMDLVTGKLKTNDPQLLLVFKQIFE